MPAECSTTELQPLLSSACLEAILDCLSCQNYGYTIFQIYDSMKSPCVGVTQNNAPSAREKRYDLGLKLLLVGPWLDDRGSIQSLENLITCYHQPSL